VRAGGGVHEQVGGLRGVDRVLMRWASALLREILDGALSQASAPGVRPGRDPIACLRTLAHGLVVHARRAPRGRSVATLEAAVVDVADVDEGGEAPR
jgi:hypothetical protein